jgi:hypothetical protein
MKSVAKKFTFAVATAQSRTVSVRAFTETQAVSRARTVLDLQTERRNGATPWSSVGEHKWDLTLVKVVEED